MLLLILVLTVAMVGIMVGRAFSESIAPSPSLVYAAAADPPSWAEELLVLCPPGVIFTSFSKSNLSPAKFDIFRKNLHMVKSLLEIKDEIHATDPSLDDLWDSSTIHGWLIEAGNHINLPESLVIEAACSVFYIEGRRPTPPLRTRKSELTSFARHL